MLGAGHYHLRYFLSWTCVPRAVSIASSLAISFSGRAEIGSRGYRASANAQLLAHGCWFLERSRFILPSDLVTILPGSISSGLSRRLRHRQRYSNRYKSRAQCPGYSFRLLRQCARETFGSKSYGASLLLLSPLFYPATGDICPNRE